MADPRAFIGMKVNKSTRSISTSSGLTALTEFCKTVNPNNSAASRVSSGLKTLSAISMAVGKGGKLPASINNVSSNASWVLNTVGINSQTLFKAGQDPILDSNGKPMIDPATGKPYGPATTVAEAATRAAQGIYNKVSKGQFSINDIPLFRPPLEAAHRVVKLDTEKTFNTPVAMGQVVNFADASPYATDLDRVRAPKQKFLFAVQFVFEPVYAMDSNFQQGVAFYVKKSSRPGIKYRTEDANYYNFRTKYTAKAEFEEMSMQFYDDGQNKLNALYTAYTRAMSPVLNYAGATQAMSMEGEGLLNNQNTGFARIPGISGNVPISGSSSVPTKTGQASSGSGGGSSGSTGGLAGNVKNIIREIRLFHVYADGKKVNVYTFINPRITSFDLDDLDMALSDVNMVDIKFNYDSVHTELDQDFDSVSFPDITGGLHQLGGPGNTTTRFGNTDYNKTQTAQQKRNACIDDAAGAVSSTIGAAGSILKKISGLF